MEAFGIEIVRGLRNKTVATPSVSEGSNTQLSCNEFLWCIQVA